MEYTPRIGIGNVFANVFTRESTENTEKMRGFLRVLRVLRGETRFEQLLFVAMKPTNLSVVVLLALLVGTTRAADAPSTQPSERTTPSGLKIIEVKKLDQAMTAQDGDLVWVHYTGKLENGTKFDSSFDRKDAQGEFQPIEFRLGQGKVIKGWDEGVAGMKVGEKRQLIIPPTLAYGAAGAGGVIPPNATLTFDVELVGMYRDSK
jgi:hypothetical protein